MKLKTLKICIGLNTCFLLTFLILAIFMPIFIEYDINLKAREGAVMTNSTFDLWGEIPGKTNFTIHREFYFFNFTNSEEFLYQGKDPIFVEVGPYRFQEYQMFLDRKFTKENNTNLGLVEYKQWIYMKELEGANQGSLNLSNQIQMINFVSLGAWYQVKTSDPNSGQLAIQTFGQTFIGIEDVLLVTSIAQGVQALELQNYQAVNNFLNGIVNEQSQIDLIYNDINQGLSSFIGISVWIQGLQDGLNSTSTFDLQNYFYLNAFQMNSIYQKLSPIAITVQNSIKNSYCSKNYTIQMGCDAQFLTALQWSTQGLTLNPPGGVKPMPSILTGNTTASGYFEISYFLKEYFLTKVINSTDPNYQNYANITFSVEWAYNFLRRGTPTDWIKDWDVLLNIGNIQAIYKYGSNYDQNQTQASFDTEFSQMKQQFQMESNYQARVLWEYVKYICNEFAIQKSIGGTQSTLGFGALATQGFYQSYIQIKNNLYDSLVNQVFVSYLDNLTCQTMFNNSIDGLTQKNIQQLCYNQNINNITYAQYLRNVCEYESADHYHMQYIGNLSNLQMLQFCDLTQTNQNSFQVILNSTLTGLKQQYNCNPVRTFCSRDEIANLQWGQSLITLNPPTRLVGKLQKTNTLTDWDNVLYPKQIEFSSVMNRYYNNNNTINQTMAYKYLNYDYLFSAPMMATAMIKRDNLTYLNNTYPGINMDDVFNYFRYIIVNQVFDGITTKRNISEILFGYDDPFLTQIKSMDPAMGGDPYIPNNVNLGQNQSEKMAMSNARVMYTGEGDYTKLRDYHSAYGLENITVRRPAFNGNTSVIQLVNPYINETKIVGNDGAFCHPNLKNDDINVDNVYVDLLFRGTGAVKTDEQPEYFGLETERFIIPQAFMQNYTQNPANKNFYQDKYDGFLNFTSAQQAPVFNSKKHFLDCDQELINRTIIYNSSDQKNRISANISTDQTYIDIEPYSGASLSLYLKLQTNLLFEPDILFNKQKQQDFMLPMFLLDRGGVIPQKALNKLFGPILEALSARDDFQIAGYILSVVFLIILLSFIYLHRKKYKNDEDDEDDEKQEEDEEDELKKSLV